MANVSKTTPSQLVWLLIFLAVLIWSGIAPKDQTVWALEVAPALAALLVLLFTYRRYPLTPLVNWLILGHCLILMVGGHYTYAEVPLFDQISAQLGWGRNNYDKLAHFVQGFVPALVAREILVRNEAVNGESWLKLFVVSFCLAFSALYELVEWWVALLSEQAADAFLGTQGYVWDTQSDMFMALLGASAAVFALRGAHDRQLRRLVQSA